MMTGRASVRETIWIEESVHELYRELTEGSDLFRTPFRTMKDMFLWAACLGFRAGERKPLASKRVTIFRWAQFSPQIDVPLVKSLCIADTGDVEVLLDTDQMMTIVEEYANAGIHELRGAIMGEQGQPLWNLVSLVK